MLTAGEFDRCEQVSAEGRGRVGRHGEEEFKETLCERDDLCQPVLRGRARESCVDEPSVSSSVVSASLPALLAASKMQSAHCTAEAGANGEQASHFVERAERLARTVITSNPRDKHVRVITATVGTSAGGDMSSSRMERMAEKDSDLARSSFAWGNEKREADSGQSRWEHAFQSTDYNRRLVHYAEGAG